MLCLFLCFSLSIGQSPCLLQTYHHSISSKSCKTRYCLLWWSLTSIKLYYLRRTTAKFAVDCRLTTHALSRYHRVRRLPDWRFFLILVYCMNIIFDFCPFFCFVLVMSAFNFSPPPPLPLYPHPFSFNVIPSLTPCPVCIIPSLLILARTVTIGVKS